MNDESRLYEVIHAVEEGEIDGGVMAG